MEKIKNLLHQVSIIRKKNDEILDATGGRFNIFGICGVNHYENTHSAILVEFLNPIGTHGLKSKFLECFLETIDTGFSIKDFNCKEATIKTESFTGDGRIDILIEDNNNKAIIIENKIYAKDQFEQLKRYNRYGLKFKNGCQILYLTLSGDKATEQSGEGVSYLPISYKENIINWLENCVQISSRHPIVRETIIQYINHLKILTNQDMDAKNKEEIIEVLSNIENLRAAKTIQENYSETFDFLCKKYFNPKMEEFAEQNGLEYYFRGSGEAYISFDFVNPIWREKTIQIGFSREPNIYYYGIVNNPDEYSLSIENKKTVHERMEVINKISGKSSVWWPFYSRLDFLTLDAWETDIINSNNFFQYCKIRIEALLEATKDLEL